MSEAKPQKARLVFQASLPVDTLEGGLLFYTELRNKLKSIDPAATISGQIVQMLEPCCTQPRKADNV